MIIASYFKRVNLIWNYLFRSMVLKILLRSGTTYHIYIRASGAILKHMFKHLFNDVKHCPTLLFNIKRPKRVSNDQPTYSLLITVPKQNNRFCSTK